MDSEVQRLLSVASFLANKFQQESEVNLIDKAIVLDRDALSLCCSGHPMLVPAALTQLALHLRDRYQKLGVIDNIDEGILRARDALQLRPPGYPSRSISMNNLALLLSTRYSRLGRTNDLDEAIALARDALALRPQGQTDQSAFLNNLANYLFARYKKSGATDDLQSAIVLCRDALDLCSPGHQNRSASLTTLAALLATRYQLLGAINDLHDAIILSRDALSPHLPKHSEQSILLSNLASYLCSRYNRRGDVTDLDEAIILARDALALRPSGHPLRSSSLTNFASLLSTRYKQLGKIDDLNEAVVLGRHAVSLCPPGHPVRSTTLSNLASYIFNRHKHLRGIDDLNEAIVLSREALSLRLEGHPLRLVSLNNLALLLSTRFGQLGGIGDLNDAIVLAQDALALCPPGHPECPTCLDNLALHLSNRYIQLGRAGDLEDAIIFARDALALRPPGHPDRLTSLNNLVGYLLTRYKLRKRIDDLDAATVLGRDVLALRPLGHPERSASLNNLASCLGIRPTQAGEEDVREELFSLFSQMEQVSQMASSIDLSAAKAWINAAELFNHPTTLLAYETTLRLLVEHLAALPALPHHHTLLKELASSLAADAFSACLRNQSPTTAVEFLEQGRGVFWSQLSRLRSPLDNVIASGEAGNALACEFMRLTASIRTVLESPGPDQHDRVCSLNMELRRVVGDIRQLPNLSRFLRPPSFSELRHAASGGPVIIINASKFSCDALIIFVDRDPLHLPMSFTKKDVQELSSKLRTLTKLAKSRDVTRDLGIFLRELWDRVVSPVVDVLRTSCPLQSRIWWCPTAEFSLLPLHAAGPFRKGQKNLSDLYISSYTPTLSALVRARQPMVRDSATQKHFVAIGQATATGAEELFSVDTEVAHIEQLVDGLATFTCVEGLDACISRVSDELGKNNWVHFACHGFPNQKDPFESAFALRDGHFTVQHILRCDLQHPEFAYLSACHTTVGDEESLDEMIHLASAMQFAGFRSVIGTMWAVDDAETNKITSVFYKHMTDVSGCLDYTRAAFALRKTMRSVKIPLDQRILYVHLGA